MQLSNRLTFSLASLVLIFALAFTATPVFAQATVTKVEFTTTGPYGVGAKVGVKVTFSEAVTVAGNTAADPNITIQGIADNAVYKSGSPGTALTFEATVASSDSDLDTGLLINANSLSAGNATIQSGAPAVEATLDHAEVAASTAQAVDTTAPTLDSGWPLPAARKNTEAINFNLAFSEAVTGVDTAFSILGGGGSLGVTGLRTQWIVTVTPPTNSEAPILVQIDPTKIMDLAKNEVTAPAALVTAPIMVDTKAPTLTIGDVAAANTTNGVVVDITKFKFKVTASEDVTGLAANDFTVTPKDHFGVAVAGSGDDYNITISASPSGSVTAAQARDYEGTVTVAIKADAAEDGDGNKSGAQSNTYDLALDKMDPGVTVNAQVDVDTAVADGHTEDFYLDIMVDESNPITAAPYGVSVIGNPTEAQGQYRIGNVTRVPRVANLYTVNITVIQATTATIPAGEITFIVDVDDAAADPNRGTGRTTVSLGERTVPTGPPTDPPNAAPVFNANAPATLTGMVGTAITAVNVSATDADTDDTLVYSWDVADEAALGLALNTSTGMITGTPLKVHDMSHTVTVNDGTVDVTHTIQVTITDPSNAAPVFNANAPATITGTVGTAITAANVSATDADGDTLTYSWDVTAANETALGLALNTSTGMITGTPLKVHDMSHTVTVNDGTVDVTHTIQVTITEATTVDPKPTFPADATIGDRVYWVDEEGITIRLPEASDDKPTDPETYKDRYAIMPELPDGLGIIFIGSTQYIAGTPAKAMVKTPYTWSYTDAGGGKAELKFSLAVLARLAPGKVAGLTATQNSHDPTAVSVDLTWDALAVRTKADANNTGNDGGSPVTHYMISWTGAGSDSMSTEKETDPDATMYTLMQNLSIGEYMFTVAAVNAIGTGAGSDAVTVDIANTPGAPRDLRAAIDQVSNRVTLNWLAPTSDGGDAISEYVVYITQPDATERVIETGSIDTLHRTDTLTQEGQYVFRVAAVNDCGVGPKSDAQRLAATILVNQPPQFAQGASISPIVAMVGTPISVPLPSATDPEGETVFYGTIPRLPAGLRVSRVGTNPAIVGTPTTATPRTLYGFVAGDFSPVSQDDTISSLPFYITVNDEIPATARIDGPAIQLPSATIGPKQFVILQRNPSDSGIYSQVPSVTVGLANLDHLFRDRGGMALHGPGSGNDLVFSEIMWGSDSSLEDDTHSQWIELYNTTNGTLQLSNYSLQFYSARIGATAGAIDEINTINWGSLHGQRGRTRGEDTQGRFSEPVEIISMYLKINYPRVERSQARGEQLKDFPNGSNRGHWAASTRPSLQIEATWRLATPGTKPRFTVHGASTLRQNVYISEIGNSSEDGYDWIELYNATDGTINLKKWELSVVTGNGVERSLFRFPDNDSHRLPGKSFLVIASTDPKNSDNDLAAGIDITKKGIDQTGKGLGTWIGGGSTADKNINALYTVRSFSLPNSGKMNIILRHEQGKLGKADKFEDVVGTLKVELRGPVPSNWTGYDANGETYFDTAFWPLHATGAPHGNVIDGTGNEDFRAGHVYQRNDFGKNTRSGIHEKDLSVRGWTGIGYDLVADRNNENGGTPGYHKDSLKSKASDVAGTVNISEIMIATDEEDETGRVPRATRLPQWIELYNSSLTQGVNINNWYFEIHNSSLDREINLSGTLRLPNVTIPPNQTIMIVSNSGLNSGNFSEARTINLYTNSTYRSILNLRNRGDSFLSSEGFYIELRDHENNHVDEIGNLGVTRRTGIARPDDDVEMWDIGPDYLNSEDGHRTSLIRVYDDRTSMARDGLLKTSWLPAAQTNFREVPSLTYFGNHRDFGTPGYRGGGPLPVSLSKFRPQRLDTGEVVIHWTTESELNNAGFNILRTEKRDGVFEQVNTELIKGHGTTSERNTYTWTDTTAKPNVVYYYQIQDVSLDGQVQTLRISRLKGNVSAAGKITTTWGELKSLQGQQ